MKFKYSRFRKIFGLITFSVLCLLVYSSGIGIAMGQKKPGSLNQGTTPDDRRLCKQGDNNDSEFCQLYNSYDKEKYNNTETARKARNEMIDLVQSQIEVYYKARKDDRKRMVVILQNIFDILEIGAASAAGIINGTLRAKSVIAQSLSGFQAGRSAFNKNTDILQTQVLINKMRSNRAEIALGIESKKRLNVDEYSWYAAKLDLIRLLNAGTFNDALDTLVRDSGDRAADSEKALADLKKERGILGEPSQTEIEINEKSGDLLEALRKAFAEAADPNNPGVITENQKNVLKKYQNIYAAIKANDLLFARFNKVPDIPGLSAQRKAEFQGILGKLIADPTKVTAVEYNRILGTFAIDVAADETLGTAFVKILTENK